MKAFKTILKIVAALAAIAGVAAVIYTLLERRNRRMDELDAYLMDDDDEHDVSVAQEAAGDEEYLDQDFKEWDSINPDESVAVSFLVDPAAAEVFQQKLAETGYSSNYDKETRILETVLNGPKDKEEISEFEEVLKELLSTTDSTYLGFAFE